VVNIAAAAQAANILRLPCASVCLRTFALNADGLFVRIARYERLRQPERRMSRICQVTGKRPVTGNNVSHAHNKTRRRFLPNLHFHRFWVESEQRWVRLRVSTRGLRIIDKKGIDQVLIDMRAQGDKV